MAINNNDILKRIRYTFDFNDQQMIEIFAEADREVTRALVTDWLKNEEHELFIVLTDLDLATFLNGLIARNRGKKEGGFEAETVLNNNLILKKLRIALNLTTEGMIEVFAAADKVVSPNEISSFFRNPKHPKYRNCMDQYLRNFLDGMQKKYHVQKK